MMWSVPIIVQHVCTANTVFFSSCSSSYFFATPPPIRKHSADSTATKTYGLIKMVRSGAFVAALLALGVTAGAPLPSTPEGE